MKISKNGKIRILIYQKSYPLTWILTISHPQVRRGKRRLKILNWIKDPVGAHLKGLLITNTPKISSRYDTPIQNGGHSNAEISCT